MIKLTMFSLHKEHISIILYEECLYTASDKIFNNFNELFM